VSTPTFSSSRATVAAGTARPPSRGGPRPLAMQRTTAALPRRARALLAPPVEPPPVESLPVQALAALLGEPELRVIELAGDGEPPPAHIPGAVLLAVTTELGPEPAEAPLPLLAGTLAGRGIGDDHLVVVYDHDGRGEAQSFAELLRRVGHPHSAFLAGGWAAWLRAGLPVSRVRTRPAPATFTARREVAS
jgi:3-mercaptopyruvate sulfurtransferase SseA